MARIGIDATAVSRTGKGIARVQRHAAEALAERGRHDVVALVRSDEGEALLSESGLRCVRVDSPLTLVLEQLQMPRAIRRAQLDVVLTTTDRIPLVSPQRFVIWLYELPTHRIAQNRRNGSGSYQRASDLITSALWRRSARLAAAVVAASHATAHELRDSVRELAAHSVVYPGLDAAFRPGSEPAADRYVLHIGSSDPRDDTETALRAFAAAREVLAAPVRLVVAGGLGDRRVLVEQEIALLGIDDDVEITGRVPDEQLVQLYQQAAVYLDCSLFEGFGYQVLEAMACGTPVVASDCTSLPELVADSGLLCKPGRADEFARALVSVLEEPQTADDLRERGLRRAREFTWERTAAGLEAALESALGR